MLRHLWWVEGIRFFSMWVRKQCFRFSSVLKKRRIVWIILVLLYWFSVCFLKTSWWRFLSGDYLMFCHSYSDLFDASKSFDIVLCEFVRSCPILADWKIAYCDFLVLCHWFSVCCFKPSGLKLFSKDYLFFGIITLAFVMVGRASILFFFVISDCLVPFLRDWKECYRVN